MTKYMDYMLIKNHSDVLTKSIWTVNQLKLLTKTEVEVLFEMLVCGHWVMFMVNYQKCEDDESREIIFCKFPVASPC